MTFVFLEIKDFEIYGEIGFCFWKNELYPAGS